MLKRFWRWLFGEPEPDRLESMFKVMLANQEKTQFQVFQAVNSISEAAGKQAEVLTQYLQLFQPKGEMDMPGKWEQDLETENKQSLLKLGFPFEGSEAEQADFILQNLDRLG